MSGTLEPGLAIEPRFPRHQPGGVGARILASVHREARVCHEFIKYDYMTGFVPPTLFVIAVAAHYHLSFADFGVVAAKGAALFLLYAYSFCLSNQLAGIAEDQANKPDRPIPRGLVTTGEAWSRLVFVLVVYAALGLWFGAGWWVLLWQGALLLHNQGRWSWNWFGKNIIMGIGTLAQLAAAWSIVAPISTVGWRWILTLSAIIFILIPLQDLRDIHGDQAVGRRTFPLVFGCGFTRLYVAVGFGFLPWVVHSALMEPAAGLQSMILDLILGAWSWMIAVRVIGWRTPLSDHLTYTLWTWWYTATLASAILVLWNEAPNTR